MQGRSDQAFSFRASRVMYIRSCERFGPGERGISGWAGTALKHGGGESPRQIDMGAENTDTVRAPRTYATNCWLCATGASSDCTPVRV